MLRNSWTNKWVAVLVMCASVLAMSALPTFADDPKDDHHDRQKIKFVIGTVTKTPDNKDNDKNKDNAKGKDEGQDNSRKDHDKGKN